METLGKESVDYTLAVRNRNAVIRKWRSSGRYFSGNTHDVLVMGM